MGAESGRTLKTARAVLRVLSLLEQAPAGLSVADVADHLGRSTSTASNLLNTLCVEGYAVRDDRTACYYAVYRPAPEPATTAGAVDLAVLDELHGRTGERTYLATVEEDTVVVQETRGRQGLPTVPGLRPTIRGEAHALAVGKAVLAHQGANAARAYHDAHGLQAFTARTITDLDALERELAEVRIRGAAGDDEEYAEGFSCLAAPLHGPDGVLVGALALSLPARRYADRRDRLIAELTSLAEAALPTGPPAATFPCLPPEPEAVRT